MVDRPLGDSQAVYSMQRKAEIAAFLRRAAALQPRAVVRLGTASGGTLFLLTRVAAPEALLISLDLPGGRFGGGYQAWRKPLYRSFATAGQRIVLLRGNSHDPALAARLRRVLAGRPIDLLFIDGDHSYEGVKTDFDDYAPLGALRRPRGLPRHRAGPAAAGPEVERFWRDILTRFPATELIESPAQQAGYRHRAPHAPGRPPAVTEPLDVAVLFTASVEVNRGITGVTHGDPRQREEEYAASLRYFLREHPRLPQARLRRGLGLAPRPPAGDRRGREPARQGGGARSSAATIFRAARARAMARP